MCVLFVLVCVCVFVGVWIWARTIEMCENDISLLRKINFCVTILNTHDTHTRYKMSTIVWQQQQTKKKKSTHNNKNFLGKRLLR